MLIRRLTDASRFVWLTDCPRQAQCLQKTAPVIGITGPGPEYELWTGVSYLAHDTEAVTDSYAERVWCRYYGETAVIVKGDGWRLREMKEADLEGLVRMYRDPLVKRFLPCPVGGDADTPGRGRTEDNSRNTAALGVTDAWRDWLEAYRREVYFMDEPAMWAITDGQDRFLGRLGLEWMEFGAYKGYYLGYGLLPEARGKGYVAKSAAALFEVLEEEWGIQQIYLACEKENQASVRCAGRLGFHEVKQQDQACLVFAMSVSI